MLSSYFSGSSIIFLRKSFNNGSINLPAPCSENKLKQIPEEISVKSNSSSSLCDLNNIASRYPYLFRIASKPSKVI